MGLTTPYGLGDESASLGGNNARVGEGKVGGKLGGVSSAIHIVLLLRRTASVAFVVEAGFGEAVW